VLRAAGPPPKNTSWEAFHVGRCAVTAVLAAPGATRRSHAALSAAAASRVSCKLFCVQSPPLSSRTCEHLLHELAWSVYTPLRHGMPSSTPQYAARFCIVHQSVRRQALQQSGTRGGAPRLLLSC
jgi:hypothetical protein